MSEEVQKSTVKNSKNARAKGIAFVGLCVLACKAPLLLVLLGFGGVGATASLLELPPLVQTIGLTVAILSVVSVLSYLAYRVYARSRT